MRILLMTLVGLALLCGGAYASVPDPDMCTVNPPDVMQSPRILGVPATAGSTAADVDIYIRAGDGTAIGNAFVEVIFNAACAVGSPPTPAAGCSNWTKTGYTSPSGFLRLNMKFGGCCQQVSSITIIADGTPIRGYDKMVSPDFDGTRGNLQVVLADFVYFAAGYGQSGNVCRNYNGDSAELCSLPDFVTFAGSYGKTCQ